MKKIFLILFIVICLASAALSAQTKRGKLLKDETWSGEIYVPEMVEVPKGITLTIKPGTVIKFKHNRDYKGGSKGSILVKGGVVKAIGTPGRQIWFTSNSPDPINGDWIGIALYKSSSIFKYVIVEFAGVGIEQFDSKTSITNSIIRWSNIEGVYAEGSSFNIENNTFYGNGYHDIALENKNKNILIKNNVFVKGQTPIIFHDTKGRIYGNYFYNNYRGPGIGILNNSYAVIEKNCFERDYYDDYSEQGLKSKIVLMENKFSVKAPPFQFDYKDIKKHVLDYHPGDPKDRYPYVYDPEDKTRRVLKRIGKSRVDSDGGLGFGWAITYANGYLWKLDDRLSKIDPDTGLYERFPTDRNGFMWPRGMAYDGEYFWTMSHVERKVIKFKFDGKMARIIKTYPQPPNTSIDQIAADEENVYIPGQKGLYVFDKELNFRKVIKLTPHTMGPIVVTKDYFFLVGEGRGIAKYTKDGVMVGSIYPPALEVLGLAWDGKYLWTLQKTCELWNDDKIFKLEILDDKE